MKKINYEPKKDRMVIRLEPGKRPHCVDYGNFRICWDESGNVQSLMISSFIEELEAFKKSLHTIRLGGIWKGLKITDSDIDEVRKELLNGLDDRW